MARKLALLLTLLAALAATASAQVIMDFWPSGTGDTVTWNNLENWWRYLDPGAATLYPRDPGSGLRDRVPYAGATVYIREANTVTIGSGTSAACAEVNVGQGTFVDSGGTLVSFAPSQLYIKNGGSLDSANGEGAAVGGYGGTITMETGSYWKNMRLYLGELGQTSQVPASTGVWNMTGGSYWAAHKTFIGHIRGVGVYNMSGGTAGFNFMHLGTTSSTGTVAGKGYLTITGGYIYSRTMEVGANFDIPGCWGELNLIGGKWDFIGSNQHQGGQSGLDVRKGIVRVGKGFSQDWYCPFNDEFYTQRADGKLIVELKNTGEFGYMAFDGATNPLVGGSAGVDLDGAFEAVAAPGASWAVGTQFRVLKSKVDSISATQTFLDSYNTIAGRLFNISIVHDPGGTGSLLLTSIHHPGDANEDQAVNVGDLGILAGNWGQGGKTWAQADFTGDGWVNVGDLGVLAGNWGWALANGPGLGIPAPEPMSLVVLGLGALALIRRRR